MVPDNPAAVQQGRACGGSHWHLCSIEAEGQGAIGLLCNVTDVVGARRQADPRRQASSGTSEVSKPAFESSTPQEPFFRRKQTNPVLKLQVQMLRRTLGVHRVLRFLSAGFARGFRALWHLGPRV